MERTARAFQRRAHTFGEKSQNGTAPDCIAPYDLAGAHPTRPRDPNDIIGRERDDLVVAAPPALIALVRERGHAIHWHPRRYLNFIDSAKVASIPNGAALIDGFSIHA